MSHQDSVPGWLRDLADAASKMEINPLTQPPAHGGRASAVLVLFAAGPQAGSQPGRVPTRTARRAANRTEPP